MYVCVFSFGQLRRLIVGYTFRCASGFRCSLTVSPRDHMKAPYETCILAVEDVAALGVWQHHEFHTITGVQDGTNAARVLQQSDENYESPPSVQKSQCSRLLSCRVSSLMFHKILFSFLLSCPFSSLFVSIVRGVNSTVTKFCTT